MFFHKVSYFLSLESGQCLQKERHSCNWDFSIHVSADFLQQKYVYESAYRKKTPNFAKATLTWAENVILCPMMQWLRIPQLFLPDIWCCHWKAGNPMITGHLGSSFYTFLTKCLISHGYRLFKCCFKCSEQCFQITLNFQTKKSMNWRMHLWCTSYDDENTTAGCIKAEHWQLNNCQILNFQGA